VRPRSNTISGAAAGLIALGLAACGDAEFVDDGARLLSEEGRARIAEYHAYLLEDHDIDYRVITRKSSADIDVFAAEAFAERSVGSESRMGKGLLLVIDAGQNRVRLEVGHALEGTFPDAFAGYIEARQMAPFLREGRVGDGILAATELIIARADRAKAGFGPEGEVWLSGSGGGGGATAPAELGAGGSDPALVQGRLAAPGDSPRATLAAYLEALAGRNGDPNLSLYTPQTRRMLAQWTLTPAQMDNAVRTYRSCGEAEERLDGSGRLAVLRYGVAKRPCAPWFFQRAGGVWLLDLMAMQQILGFGRDNSWHLSAGPEHSYGFAFTDWRFDANGFPLEP